MKKFKFLTGHIGGILVYPNIRLLRASWSRELDQDVSAFRNIDAEAELTSLLSNQIAAEVDSEIFNTMFRIGTTTLASDLISVQPLSAPVGLLYYYDFKYNLLNFKFFRK